MEQKRKPFQNKLNSATDLYIILNLITRSKIEGRVQRKYLVTDSENDFEIYRQLSQDLLFCFCFAHTIDGITVKSVISQVDPGVTVSSDLSRSENFWEIIKNALYSESFPNFHLFHYCKTYIKLSFVL